MKYIEDRKIFEAGIKNGFEIDVNKDKVGDYSSVKISFSIYNTKDYDYRKMFDEYSDSEMAKFFKKQVPKYYKDLIEGWKIAEKFKYAGQQIRSSIQVEVYDKEFVVYLPGGKNVDMPNKTFRASMYNSKRNTNLSYFWASGYDNFSVDYSVDSSRDNYSMDELIEFFSKKHDTYYLEKTESFKSLLYWLNRSDKSDSMFKDMNKKPGVVAFKKMLNKAYMKEFDIMDGLQKDFGVFDED